jgi:hypothetical protein
MPAVISGVEVKMIGWPAVPRALSVPLLIVRLVPASNAITTPGSMVRVDPFAMETSAVTWYGLSANDQVVLVLMIPDTLVAACVTCIITIKAMTVSNNALTELFINVLICNLAPSLLLIQSRSLCLK